MHLLVGLVSLAALLGTLWDAFETIILPRRIRRRLRLTSLIYHSLWEPWRATGRVMSERMRESILAIFGPLSLILLLALWASALIFGYGALQWAIGSDLRGPDPFITFGTDLYMSGTTFLTLGLGDVSPVTPLARAITVLEAATGFGLFALVIGYVPVLYQAFSRREVMIALLDARAGSPATAGELIRRNLHPGCDDEMVQLMRDWERWAAELLESHISYPVLSFFRSQHEHQSWLASLTTILDAATILSLCASGEMAHASQLTYAMARHAAVDLSQVINIPPNPHAIRPVDENQLQALFTMLEEHGLRFDRDFCRHKLLKKRKEYEPFVAPLAGWLAMSLPAWMPEEQVEDDWQRSPLE
jgi:hypothetical protein